MIIKRFLMLLTLLFFNISVHSQSIMGDYGVTYNFFRPLLYGKVKLVKEREYLIFDQERLMKGSIKYAYDKLEKHAFNGLNSDDYVFVGDINVIREESDLNVLPFYKTTSDFVSTNELHEQNYYRGDTPLYSSADVYCYDDMGWCTSASFTDNNGKYEFENSVVDDLLIAQKGFRFFKPYQLSAIKKNDVAIDIEWIVPNQHFKAVHKVNNVVEELEIVEFGELGGYNVTCIVKGNLYQTIKYEKNVYEFNWFYQEKVTKKLIVTEEICKTDQEGNWLVKKRTFRGDLTHFDRLYVREITYRE
ncbi:MAG: hypothetical protein ACRCVU_20865 [Flavobacterium sp.]